LCFFSKKDATIEDKRYRKAVKAFIALGLAMIGTAILVLIVIVISTLVLFNKEIIQIHQNNCCIGNKDWKRTQQCPVNYKYRATQSDYPTQFFDIPHHERNQKNGHCNIANSINHFPYILVVIRVENYG